MITEKPSWIRHEGLQIFSIDIQPGGLRFATGGGDQKVSCVFVFVVFPLLASCLVRAQHCNFPFLFYLFHFFPADLPCLGLFQCYIIG
jgi:hypothetical protein